MPSAADAPGAGGGARGGAGGGAGGDLRANPVVRALLDAAVRATGASCGWLASVRGDGDELVVVGAAGERAGSLPGNRVPAGSGTAGFVVASGQPVALTASGDEGRLSEGIAARLDTQPVSIVSVPCATADGVIGALELADKTGGGSFTFDDVELATLLGGIAAAALACAPGTAGAPPAPDPRRLGTELSRLAGADPPRYAAIATAIDALLAGA